MPTLHCNLYTRKSSSSVQLYINFNKNNNVKPKNISTKWKLIDKRIKEKDNMEIMFNQHFKEIKDEIKDDV